MLGAIVWDLLTWWFGLPTSSHTIIGGYAGAAMARGMFAHGFSGGLHAHDASRLLVVPESDSGADGYVV